MADWKQPILYYIYAITGIGIYNILLVMAFHHAPAFEANVLNYLWPILITAFSCLLFKRPLKANKAIGISMGFVGAVCLFFATGGGEISSGIQSGHIFAASGAIIWALYSVLTQRYHYPSGFIAPVMFICSILCGVLHFALEETVRPSLWVGGVVLLAGATRFCYALWDYAMRHGDQMMLSSAAYFTPLISVILFIIFGFKPASPLIGVAGFLIITGCIVANAHHLKRLKR